MMDCVAQWIVGVYGNEALRYSKSPVFFLARLSLSLSLVSVCVCVLRPVTWAICLLTAI